MIINGSRYFMMCEMSTRICVGAGSFEPSDLKILANDGTMKISMTINAMIAMQPTTIG